MTTPLNAVRSDDPYPYYAALTAKRPFAFDDEIDSWVAADAEAVQAAFNASELGVRASGDEVPAAITDTPAGEVFGQLVRMRDDEAAAELKTAITTVLTGVTPEAIAEATRRRAREALEDGIDYRALAFGVPVAAVGSLCGIPENDLRRAVELTAAFVRCVPASAGTEDYAAANEAAARLQPLLAAAAERDGLAARLVETVATGHVPRRPALANAVGLLSQTYDATAGLVGNTLLGLGRHERGEDLRAFVDEIARHDAPIQNTRRFAHRPWSHGGQSVAAGQKVLLLLAAANRDPDVNPEPDVFDPARRHPVSFTFGSGRHGCPGRAVAIEIAVAIVAEAEAAGWTPRDLPGRNHYLPSPNARIPVLEGGTS